MNQPTLAQIIGRYLSRRRRLQLSLGERKLVARYRNIEVLNVVDRDIWIRREVPEDRSRIYVRSEDPQFFAKLNKGLRDAAKLVDEVHKINEVLAFRISH